MKYWQKYLLLYLLLVAVVAWGIYGTGMHLTMEQTLPMIAILLLHQRMAVLAERHDVERRRNRTHYSDSGQEE